MSTVKQCCVQCICTVISHIVVAYCTECTKKTLCGVGLDFVHVFVNIGLFSPKRVCGLFLKDRLINYTLFQPRDWHIVSSLQGICIVCK